MNASQIMDAYVGYTNPMYMVSGLHGRTCISTSCSTIGLRPSPQPQQQWIPPAANCPGCGAPRSHKNQQECAYCGRGRW